MVTAKKRWTKTAAKLALTMAMSAFSMATTPAAAAADPVSVARAAALHSTRHFEEADMFRIILALVTLTLPVAAHDTGQWENQPIYLRQWFQKLMQPDNRNMSCYGEADALEADSFEVRGDQYVAIITNGKGIIPEGTRISVPKNKVKWDNGNPTGHGIIFIGNAGQIYCYVTPGGTASW